jgi:hypothetical protein
VLAGPVRPPHDGQDAGALAGAAVVALERPGGSVGELDVPLVRRGGAREQAGSFMEALAFPGERSELAGALAEHGGLD